MRWLLPLLTLPLVITAVEGQEADARWQQRNDHGNRYEGRVEIPVGNPQLEVLSFLGHKESYSGSADLYVRFFLPTRTEVSIRARELEERVNYWMEAKPQDWEPGQWPAVCRGQHLTPPVGRRSAAQSGRGDPHRT